jgi:glycosyltransferase involved in cell wall biosynthesis
MRWRIRNRLETIKLKILMVLTYYRPHWTGLTNNARWLAEGLAGRGHEVTVLTSQHEPDLPLEETLSGVRVIRLPVLKRVSRGVLMPSFPTRLWQLMREADVVQMHTPLLEAPLVALYGRLIHRPVIFTHHGDLVMPPGLFNRAVEAAVTRLMTLGLAQSTWITALNKDYAQNSPFLQPFSHKLSCIYPPVGIPHPDLEAAAQWRAELGLSQRPVIGFAGRWVEEKGFDYLLQAIPAVLQALPDAHFLYAGETQVVYEDFFAQCQPLLAAVQPHVSMLGLIKDRQKLANFYQLCDVFVLPSRTDCFPDVQLEAMMCGTPVVASDIPGGREPVMVTGMGCLAPSGQPDELARRIVEVWRDRQRYVRPRKDLEAIFNETVSLNQYELLMERLVWCPDELPQIIMPRRRESE